MYPKELCLGAGEFTYSSRAFSDHFLIVSGIFAILRLYLFFAVGAYMPVVKSRPFRIGCSCAFKCAFKNVKVVFKVHRSVGTPQRLRPGSQWERIAVIKYQHRIFITK